MSMKPVNHIKTKYAVPEETTGTAQPALVKQTHPDWQAFLALYNVASAERREYRTGTVVFSLRYFLGFSGTEEEDFVAVNNRLPAGVTAEFAAIALTDSGDFIFMNHDTGWIYYGKKEEITRAVDEETLLTLVFYLSGSLADFTDALKNPPRLRKYNVSPQYKVANPYATCE